MSFGGGTGGSGSIATDDDVLLSNAANNQVLAYVSGSHKWANKPLSDLYGSVSVKDFGAKGNGSADDTSAIQAAFNAAKPGQIVLIPSGTYLIGSELTIPDGGRVSGYGATLKRGAANGTLLSNILGDGSGAGGTPVYTGYSAPGNIIIEGLSLDSNGAVNQTNHDLCAFVHCENLVLRDMTFLRTRGFHASEINACRNVLIDNCRYEGYFVGGAESNWQNKECIQIDIGSDNTMCKNIVIRGCYAGPDDQGNPAPQVLAGSHSAAANLWHENIVLTDCIVEEIAFALTTASTWKSASITNNVVRSASTYGVRITNATTGVVVSGNRIEGPSSLVCVSIGTGGVGSPTQNLVIGNRCTGGSLGDSAAPAGNQYTANLMETVS